MRTGQLPGEGCVDFGAYLWMLLRSHGYDRGRKLEIAAAPAETVAERMRQAAVVREQWQASDSRSYPPAPAE